MDANTNSDQNEHKANFDQNIRYFFDPDGPHTPLVNLDPVDNPYEHEVKPAKLQDYRALNPQFLHKKYVDLRFSKDETNERMQYFMNRLQGLGHAGGQGLVLPMLKKKYPTSKHVVLTLLSS